MPPRDEEPRPAELVGPYRIATVAELTGVPEPTLRAWERRYGVPAPERTTSGYRLYGAAQVDEVRVMRGLCDQGIAAAEAAEIVRTRRGQAALVGEPVAVASDLHEAAVEAIVLAVERYDSEALEHHVRRLSLLGSALTVIDRVLTPVLRTIGDRWHAGAMTVAQERLASQRIGTFLRDVLRLTSADDAPDRVVLACFADDDHELGLLVTAVRLAVWGMKPIYIGGQMPPAALGAVVGATAPKLVALSVTVEPSRARARELVEEYRAACAGVPWIVGGAAVEAIADLIEKLGGRVAPADPVALRALVEGLRGHPRTQPDRAPRGIEKGRGGR